MRNGVSSPKPSSWLKNKSGRSVSISRARFVRDFPQGTSAGGKAVSLDLHAFQPQRLARDVTDLPDVTIVDDQGGLAFPDAHDLF
jgi:hypothetical protein